MNIYINHIKTDDSLPTMQQIGEKIQNLLKKIKRNQIWLSEKCGYTPVTLSKKLAPGAHWPKDRLRKVADALGVKMEYLLDRSRSYELGDDIPDDVILSQDMESDAAEAIRSMNDRVSLLERHMLHEKLHLATEIKENDADYLKARVEELTQKLNELLQGK